MKKTIAALILLLLILLPLRACGILTLDACRTDQTQKFPTPGVAAINEDIIQAIAAKASRSEKPLTEEDVSAILSRYGKTFDQFNGLTGGALMEDDVSAGRLTKARAELLLEIAQTERRTFELNVEAYRITTGSSEEFDIDAIIEELRMQDRKAS